MYDCRGERGGGGRGWKEECVILFIVTFPAILRLVPDLAVMIDTVQEDRVTRINRRINQRHWQFSIILKGYLFPAVLAVVRDSKQAEASWSPNCYLSIPRAEPGIRWAGLEENTLHIYTSVTETDLHVTLSRHQFPSQFPAGSSLDQFLWLLDSIYSCM